MQTGKSDEVESRDGALGPRAYVLLARTARGVCPFSNRMPRATTVIRRGRAGTEWTTSVVSAVL